MTMKLGEKLCYLFFILLGVFMVTVIPIYIILSLDDPNAKAPWGSGGLR